MIDNFTSDSVIIQKSNLIRRIKIHKLPSNFFEFFETYFVNERIETLKDNYMIDNDADIKRRNELKLVISDNIEKESKNWCNLLVKTEITSISFENDSNKKYPIFLIDEFSSTVCIFMNFNISLGSQLIDIGINQFTNCITAPPKIDGRELDWNKTLHEQK